MGTSIYYAAESIIDNIDEKSLKYSDASKEPFKSWPNDAGFNASVEQKDPTHLKVQGIIPPCVAGNLYRTGPGHYQLEGPFGTYKTNHWFDGFTQIHRFQIIPNGNNSCAVKYNSRRQVDALLENVQKTGKYEQISFGQKKDPCTSLFEKLKTVFVPRRSSDPYEANIGVTISTNPSGLQSISGATTKATNQELPKTLIVKSDNNIYKEIDIETLEPIGLARQEQLHPHLKGPMSCAHAQTDPKTGDLFNYNLDFGKVGTYRIFKTSFATGETEILATVSEQAAYIHSFFLTEDFVILAVWSSHFALNGVKILWERNMMDAIEPFNPKSSVKWIVIDRKHGNGVVARFESPAMFSFHTVNAWQEPGEKDQTVNVFCDVIQFKNLDILHKFYYENLVSTGSGVQEYAHEPTRSNVSPNFFRYRLGNVPFGSQSQEKANKPSNAEVMLQILGPLVGELPRINPAYFTKKARFIYSVADEGRSSFFDGLVKLDTETKEATYWRTPKHTPGEAIFIQDPERKGEDAGFLLSVVLDGEKGTSYLLCLDAKTMKEVGRAECEVPVGFGFHGSHVSP